MAKQANRKMIGGFVIIAVGILAASVAIFGSGGWFKESLQYVLYFQESVKGLDVGAPVLYRGFPVGEVKKVVIRADMTNQRDLVLVYVSIFPENVVVMTEDMEIENWQDRMSDLIDLGMRAKLTLQSFVTGKLAIELDSHPETSATLMNIDNKVEEIPTIPSTHSKLEAALGKLDLETISDKLVSVLTSADRILKNPDIDASISEFKGALLDARVLMQNVNSKVDPLTDNLNSTLTDTRKLVNHVDQKVDPVTKALVEALESADAAFISIEDILGKRSATRVDIENALQEITGAARSVRILTEYLQQHPEALLKGKSTQNY